jgi:hypothetical protein
MKFKTLMTTKAIVCLGFGPLLLFFPAWLLNLLGMGFSSGAALTAREYGATLMGNLLMTWMARNAEESVTRRAIVWNLYVYDAIALAATLVFLLQGVMNPLGWGIAAVYLYFTAGFGYFAHLKKQAG